MARQVKNVACITQEIKMSAFQVGLMLGLSLIIAIGAQNVFLIRQGVLNQHPYFSAFICLLCDAFLMSIGVLGLGVVLLKAPMVQTFMLVGAALFLGVYGASCFYRAFKTSGSKLNVTEKQHDSQKRVLILALTFSLLNPQAVLDTVILIGGSATHYHGLEKYYFLLGSVSSSFLWFMGLVFFARKYAYLLQKPRVWQCLEVISGTLMWGVLIILIEKWM